MHAYRNKHAYTLLTMYAVYMRFSSGFFPGLYTHLMLAAHASGTQSSFAVYVCMYVCMHVCMYAGIIHRPTLQHTPLEPKGLSLCMYVCMNV